MRLGVGPRFAGLWVQGMATIGRKRNSWCALEVVGKLPFKNDRSLRTNEGSFGPRSGLSEDGPRAIVCLLRELFLITVPEYHTALLRRSTETGRMLR
jgi:hypothetical protein